MCSCLHPFIPFTNIEHLPVPGTGLSSETQGKPSPEQAEGSTPSHAPDGAAGHPSVPLPREATSQTAPVGAPQAGSATEPGVTPSLTPSCLSFLSCHIQKSDAAFPGATHPWAAWVTPGPPPRLENQGSGFTLLALLPWGALPHPRSSRLTHTEWQPPAGPSRPLP